MWEIRKAIVRALYYLLSEKTTHTRAHAPRERERESTHPDERMEEEEDEDEEVVFFFVHRRAVGF